MISASLLLCIFAILLRDGWSRREFRMATCPGLALSAQHRTILCTVGAAAFLLLALLPVFGSPAGMRFGIASIVSVAIEELIFRRIIISRWGGEVGRVKLLLASSVVFGVLHFGSGLGVVPILIMIGIFLSFLTLYSGGIYLSFSIHSAWNASMVAYGSVVDVPFVGVSFPGREYNALVFLCLVFVAGLMLVGWVCSWVRKKGVFKRAGFGRE
jgi:membrane protease YdiL (CAAX protease family)